MTGDRALLLARRRRRTGRDEPASVDAPSATLGNQALQRALAAGVDPAQLRLASVAGNRAMQRLLARQALPPNPWFETTADGIPPGGNPLVGLTLDDGITLGTWERRPRVKLLQEKLNERTAAGLVPDGMFGPKTLAALNTFQAGMPHPASETVDQPTGDALMGLQREEGEEKNENGDLPIPQTTPELEAVLDEARKEYKLQMTFAMGGIQAMQRDLGAASSDAPRQTGLLTLAIRETFSGFAVAGPACIRDAVALATLLPLEYQRKGVDAIYEAINAVAFLSAGVQVEAASSEATALDQYVAAHLEVIKAATEAALARFDAEARPQFRLLHEDDFPGIPDPRVARAQKLVDGLRRHSGTSSAFAYDTALRAWSAYLAQTKAGLTASLPGATNMAGAPKEAGGVVEIEIDAGDPGAPVEVEGATVHGLSQAAVDQLLKNIQIGEREGGASGEALPASVGRLDLPRRARGHAGDWPARQSTIINIGKNERDEVSDTGSTGRARAWLAERGSGQPADADRVDAAATLVGAEMLWDELDQKRVADLGGLKAE